MNIATINSSQNLADMAHIMPQLPSFTDILKSFNETSDNKITVIENTTNVSVKSILQNSNETSVATKQSIMCKHTKHVRFKVKLEEYPEDNNKAYSNNDFVTEMETNLSSNSPTSKEIITKPKVLMESSLHNGIETVDLLTPSQNVIATVKPIGNTTNNMENSQSTDKEPIEILESLTFKAPPITIFKSKEINNNQLFDNKIQLLNTTTAATTTTCSTQLNSTYTIYTTSADSVQNSSNTLNKTFYEEFINASNSSTEVSPKTQISGKRSVVKDFESYINETKEFLFSSNDVKNTKHKAQTIEPTIQNQQPNEEGNKNNLETDFLDFGNEEMGFTFDSDDNMIGNRDNSDLDFM